MIGFVVINADDQSIININGNTLITLVYNLKFNQLNLI